jgi:hypothetical protein
MKDDQKPAPCIKKNELSIACMVTKLDSLLSFCYSKYKICNGLEFWVLCMVWVHEWVHKWTSYNKTKNFKWNGFFLMITTNPDNKFPMSITIVQMKIHNII